MVTPAETPDPLRPESLTWAALLGRWVEFARASTAWPADAAGRRWKDSVPDVVQLQAVWFALGHTDELDDDQRALGCDRAAVLIARHGGALRQRWSAAGDEMPDGLADLIRDAESALAAARGSGRGGEVGPDGVGDTEA
ncbi:MAG: hypothetical protein AAF710_09500 [Planctomycetota bacterium]